MYANGRVNLQFCYQLSYFTRVCILNGKIIKAEEVFSLSQTISFHCQAKFFFLTKTEINLCFFVRRRKFSFLSFVSKVPEAIFLLSPWKRRNASEASERRGRIIGKIWFMDIFISSRLDGTAVLGPTGIRKSCYSPSDK